MQLELRANQDLKDISIPSMLWVTTATDKGVHQVFKTELFWQNGQLTSRRLGRITAVYDAKPTAPTAGARGPSARTSGSTAPSLPVAPTPEPAKTSSAAETKKGYDRQLIIKILTGETAADLIVVNSADNLQKKDRAYNLEGNEILTAPKIQPDQEGLALLAGESTQPIQESLGKLTAHSRLCLVGHGSCKMQTLGGWKPEQVATLIALKGQLRVKKISLVACQAAETEAGGYRTEIGGHEAKLNLAMKDVDWLLAKMATIHLLSESEQQELLKDKERIQRDVQAAKLKLLTAMVKAQEIDEKEEALRQKNELSSNSFAARFHYYLGKSLGVYTEVTARVPSVIVLAGKVKWAGRKVTSQDIADIKQIEFDAKGMPEIPGVKSYHKFASKYLFYWEPPAPPNAQKQRPVEYHGAVSYEQLQRDRLAEES
jgi:hypothetical protein